MSRRFILFAWFIVFFRSSKGKYHFLMKLNQFRCNKTQFDYEFYDDSIILSWKLMTFWLSLVFLSKKIPSWWNLTNLDVKKVNLTANFDQIRQYYHENWWHLGFFHSSDEKNSFFIKSNQTRRYKNRFNFEFEVDLTISSWRSVVYSFLSYFYQEVSLLDEI